MSGCQFLLVIIENHIFTRGYATSENIAFYDHSWNKFLSYTNIQQISSITWILGLGEVKI